jgi:NAD(P)-dependent dehydrogenase (short-subunit alcohol dehydrogenase family)
LNHQDFFSFENKHIVIAGGTSGIGLAVANLVKKQGGKVTIIGRDLLKLEELKSQGFECIQHDLFDIDSLLELAKQIQEFDGLLYAAGIAESPRPYSMLSKDILQDLLSKNCVAPFELIVKLSKARKIKNGASICYVTSVTEKCGPSGSGGYGASKTAFSALSRSMGIELAKKKVRINSVAFGYVKTKFLDDLGVSEEMLNLAPLGLPNSNDAAGVPLFLLSDSSKFITRQTIVADSGITLHQALV